MDTTILREFLARYGENDSILTTKKELQEFMLEVLTEQKKRDHSKKLCQKIHKNN